MVSDSLVEADLILFWASRCVIPSVLTPSMAEMMSPWAKLPPTALLPGVIYAGVNRAGQTDTDSSGNTQAIEKHMQLHKHIHTLQIGGVFRIAGLILMVGMK